MHWVNSLFLIYCKLNRDIKTGLLFELYTSVPGVPGQILFKNAEVDITEGLTKTHIESRGSHNLETSNAPCCG